MKFPINFYLSIVTALLVIVTIQLFGYLIPEKSKLEQIHAILGLDTVSGFVIKAILYWLFIYSLLEIIRLRNLAKKEEEAVGMNLLDHSGSVHYDYQALATTATRMEHFQRRQPRILVTLIENACNALINSDKTISEGLSMVSAQLAIYRKKTSSQIAIISNLANSMIAIGLIGSLIGISGSLGDFQKLFEITDKAEATQNISGISNFLSTAWNTTLLGFMFSIIVKYSIFHLNDYSVHVVNKLEQYIIDNLFSHLGRKPDNG